VDKRWSAARRGRAAQLMNSLAGATSRYAVPGSQRIPRRTQRTSTTSRGESKPARAVRSERWPAKGEVVPATARASGRRCLPAGSE
jgi:hypothetical protein